MALRDQIKDAVAKHSDTVGLADNGRTEFQCGTCEYFYDNICKNKHPKLNGRHVEDEWCCNLYDHDGMKVVVA